MLDDDRLCRAALFPKFVGNAGVFDPEALLSFPQIEKTGIYVMSVASMFLAKSEEGVHAYGCATATAMNDRFERMNGRLPRPIDEEVHYLGYYEFTCGQLLSVSMSYYRIGCRWMPENGQDVHFQAEMYPKHTLGTHRERRNDRIAAVGMLYSRLKGPWRYISGKDELHRQQLEAIELPDRNMAD
jgi:hypothetical protein